jgi:hypothetical protein
MPTTTLGVVIPRAPTLYNDRMSVVDAKEKRPLSRNAKGQPYAKRKGQEKKDLQWAGVAKLDATGCDGVNVRSFDVRHLRRHFFRMYCEVGMCCVDTTVGH